MKLIRVDDDDRVVAVAKVISEKDENGAVVEPGAETGGTPEPTPPANDVAHDTDDESNEAGESDEGVGPKEPQG